jgi:hypothetical protein
MIKMWKLGKGFGLEQDRGHMVEITRHKTLLFAKGGETKDGEPKLEEQGKWHIRRYCLEGISAHGS